MIGRFAAVLACFVALELNAASAPAAQQPAAPVRDSVPPSPVADSQPRPDSTPHPAPPQKRPATLAPVRVTVNRDAPRAPLDLPYAISVTLPDSSRPGQSHTQLNETLFELPGVSAQNQFNPSQDPRISIRGFGSRAAFGVRDVRILMDGMPLTTADGQTAVDFIDLESIGSVEVIRGEASALYGNGAGGVIALHSAAPPSDGGSVLARDYVGSNGLERWVTQTGGTSTNGVFTYDADLSHTNSAGARQYSHLASTTGSARATLTEAGTLFSLQVLGFDEPTAEDPGALTRAEYTRNADSAAAPYVAKRARKSVDALQEGLTVTHPLGDAGQVSALLWGGARRLDNPLTYATVGYHRGAGGGSLRANYAIPSGWITNRLSAGIDYERQDDDRFNWDNCNGLTAPATGCPIINVDRGAVTLDQRELVSAIGPYVRDELDLGDRFRLTVGARDDNVYFGITDHLPVTSTNPDDSGNRTLQAVSPQFGFVAKLSPLDAFYANVSTAFDTPTTTEIDTKPDGSGGINPNLDPEYATTYEIGFKGIVFSGLRYDLAAFDTFVRDELVPYDAGNGRTYYRNAGHTRRRGLEGGLTSTVGPFDLGATYSYSHFQFTNYVVDSASYAGHWIPGIPQNQFQTSATYRYHTLFATAEGTLESSMFVDDGNAAPRAPGYGLLNLRTGGTALFGIPWASVAFGLENVFNRRYISAVAINATGGRYYEPGPGRAVYAMFTLAAGH
jgi:iron complex outermembrane receptor protein